MTLVPGLRRKVAGTPGPLPSMKAAGVTPTTAVKGAAAAITKNTICGTPSAFLRKAPMGMSVGISA